MASGYPDWLRAFSMLGKYGTDYVVVAVTEEGNLYTLLQGETVDEELKTVRLDDEGRMSAFVIDSVDAWGQMLSIGNAELAARLGSPVLYEQSGRVQFMESFEQGLGLWEQTLGGGGAAIAIDPVYSRHGGYSAKLTGGNTTGWYAKISYTHGISAVETIGVAFAYSAPVAFDRITLVIGLYDGTMYHKASLKIDDVNDEVYILDQDVAWQHVLSVAPSSGLARSFFFVKLTLDVATGHYKALKFNKTTVDISAYEIWSGASVISPAVHLELTLYSRDGENDIAYFDDIILTTAEP